VIGRDKRTIGGPPLTGFAITLVLAGFAWALLTIYEFVALDLYPVREEPALYTPYFLARSGFALIVSIVLIGTLYRFAAPDSSLNTGQLDPMARRIAVWASISGLGSAALLLTSPAIFMEMTQEDTFIEWASALLLFVASGCFVAETLRRIQSGQGGGWIAKSELVIAAGLALLLLLIAMEEISWGQRLFEFDTPEEIQQMNWQGEFNFHNLQTDLSETLYYTGVGFFLLVLPLVREVAFRGPDWFDRLLAFAPGRSVAAISAPTAMVNYGHWNLIPVQVTAFCALLAMLVYAGAAKKRHDGQEFALFLFLAASIVLTQGIFLIFGVRMPEVGNATEFKELFITIGLCWYGIDRFKSRSGLAGKP
jgi:branched-subunit amino acid transport protein